MKREVVDAMGNGPEAVLVLLLVAAFLIWQFLKVSKRGGWGRRRGFTKGSFQRKQFPKQSQVLPFPSSKPDIADPEVQLQAISKVNFEKRRLMNKTEYGVFQILEKLIADIGDGHRIMVQTSLGELIGPKSNSGTKDLRKSAYASINSKRLDFAIVDKYGLLVVAVEVQGAGHYHHKTFMRDAVKREALRRAGVELVEVQQSWTPEEIAQRVRTLLSG